MSPSLLGPRGAALVGLVEHPVGAGRADIARKGPDVAAFDRIVERTGNHIAVLVAGDGGNIRHEQYRYPRHAPVELGGMDARFLYPDQAIVEDRKSTRLNSSH